LIVGAVITVSSNLLSGVAATPSPSSHTTSITFFRLQITAVPLILFPSSPT
jgi:hypothetical protein